MDGLYDPLAYLAHLQARASRQAGGPVYIAVEKILCGAEELPCEWPVAGTTGYEFLGAVNNLFVHADGLRSLGDTYAQFTGAKTDFYEIAYSQKKKIMEDLFAGEIRTLGLHLVTISSRYRHARDLSPQELNRALLEVTASMPVYRSYTRDFRVGSHDLAFIEDAIASARRRAPDITPACFDFVRRVLLVSLPDDEDAFRFVMRWQQLTGPVMAKGVEDTTMYVFNRLVSMNDVGTSPEPVSIDQFHRFNRARRQKWPGTMNATSTPNCPQCKADSTNQIIVGLAGRSAQACIYNGGMHGDGVADFLLKAPAKQGTYDVRFRLAQAPNCQEALKNWWNLGSSPSEEATIGHITVRSSV